MTLGEQFRARTGAGSDLRRLVVEVSRIPYGRTTRRSAAAVVDEWRGTCSTKHLLLRDLVEELLPEVQIELLHRPYRVTRVLARDLWGEEASAAVPEDGLTDVHTFARVTRDGRRLIVDVTFPLHEWDGSSDIPPACGDGIDHEAGPKPLETKEALVTSNCDPAVREPFIEALSRL